MPLRFSRSPLPRNPDGNITQPTFALRDLSAELPPNQVARRSHTSIPIAGAHWLKRPPPIISYSVGLFLGVLAEVVRLPLHPSTFLPFITHVPFILVSAAFGGLGPGLLTTVLCTLEAMYFATEPVESLRLADPRNWLGVAALVITGVAASVILDRLKSYGDRLRAACLELAAVQGSAPVMLLVVDGDLHVRKANDLALQFAGPDVTQVLGSGPGVAIGCLRALSDPQGCGHGPACATCQIRRAVADTVQTGRPHREVEAWAPLSVNGRSETRCLQISTVPILLDGSTRSALVCAQDITQRKRAEDELRHQRDALRRQAALIDLSHDAVIVADRNRVITGWNSGAQEIYGWTETEAFGKVMHEFLRTSAAVTPAAIDEILAQSGRWDGDLQHRRHDGSLILVDSRQVLLRDAQGSVEGILEINRDITDRVMAEQRLRESEQNLRRFTEEAPVAIAMFDREMRYVATSARYRRDYNLGRQPLAGRSHYDVFPEIPGHWREIHRRCLQGAVERSDGEPFPRADGTEQCIRWEIQPWRHSDGEIGGLVLFSEDITSQTRAEKASREAEARFRQVFENAPTGILVSDWEGRLVQSNPAICNLLGYSEEELLGSPFSALIPPEDMAPSVTETARVRMGQLSSFEMESRYLRKNGQPVWVHKFISLLPNETGGPAQIMALVTDITVRKRAEEQIRRMNTELEERVRERTAQLEAANQELESFAYSVSHDLRAPLRGIDGWSMALVEDFGPKLEDEARHYLARVRSEAQRMGQLIDDLLRLSRVTRGPLAREPVDLTATARSIADNLRDCHPDREIEFVIEPGLTAQGDAHLLEVALTNLLSNAVKFTGKRAHARIEFGRAERDGHTAFFLRDNGAGFDMAYAKTLFGPFQRLHRASEFPGTGIGLATVQRIIHRHGGRIWADAQVNQGATFYFTLDEGVQNGPPRATLMS